MTFGYDSTTADLKSEPIIDQQRMPRARMFFWRGLQTFRASMKTNLRLDISTLPMFK
jgi:hypothetical protein